MAIFHLSAKIISRGKGQSAVASAAYRSATKLHDDRYDEVKDFSRKRFVEHSEIQLPVNAPKEYQDRGTLWNAVEKSERANNAQLAREIEVAIPKELDDDQRIRLVHDYVEQNFVSQGMIADWSLHNPQPDKSRPDREQNPHAHIMLTVRSLKANGKWAPKRKSTYKLDENGKKIPVIDPKTGKQKLGARNAKQWVRESVSYNDWNNRENVEKWRQAWADSCNKYLEAELQIDHRSYKRQGKLQVPTVHEGYYARKIERESPGSSELVAKNRKIRAFNLDIQRLQEQLKKIEKAIKEFKEKIKNLAKSVKQESREKLDKLKRSVPTPIPTPTGSGGRSLKDILAQRQAREEQEIENIELEEKDSEPEVPEIKSEGPEITEKPVVSTSTVLEEDNYSDEDKNLSLELTSEAPKIKKKQEMQRTDQDKDNSEQKQAEELRHKRALEKARRAYLRRRMGRER